MPEEKKHKLTLIFGLSILIGFSQALILYVASSYFKELSGREDVSIFYFFTYLVVLLALINLHKAVKNFGKTNVLLLSLLGEAITIAALLVSPSNLFSIVCLIAYMIFESLAIVSMDTVLESYSKDNAAGRIRGAYMTIFNAGFLVGPLLSTYIIENFNYVGVFVLLLVLKSVILAAAYSGLHNVNHHFHQRETVGKLLSKAWQNKGLMKIYYVAFALEFFYALMIIYSPIYLRDLGMSWHDIGYIFAFMLVPFLLLEYPLGWLADKKWGEKEMILIALSWIAFFTSLVYMTDSAKVGVWIALLVGTRIGAASINILRDSYFYKIIDGEDVDLINFFRTAAPVAYVVAAILSAGLLYFFSVREVFALIVLVVLSALFPAARLKDSVSEEERAELAAIRPVSVRN